MGGSSPCLSPSLEPGDQKGFFLGLSFIICEMGPRWTCPALCVIEMLASRAVCSALGS